MIIIDYAGLAIGPIKMGLVDASDENHMRHQILNSIRMYRKKYKERFGEIVICADSGNNWRKKLYPEYKAKRHTDRADDKIDWEAAFKNMRLILDEIREFFPYKVMQQDTCEADDIIAVLVRETQDFGSHDDVMIVASDHDFKQLQKYSNVKQYSPITKKLVIEDDPIRYRAEHILKGCGGDGVPNVLSDDDIFLRPGVRQNILTAKKKKILLEDPKALGPVIHRNYWRNKVMISLTEDHALPKPVIEEIISKYNEQDPTANKSKVLPYMIDKNCRRLIEDIQEFIL